MSPLCTRLWSTITWMHGRRLSLPLLRQSLCHASVCSARSTTRKAWPQKRGEMFSTFMAKKFLTKSSRELLTFLKSSMESCQLAELKYTIFSGTGRKTKKLRCSKLFLSKISIAWAPRGINISISIQVHNPYTVGKLLIRRVKVCNFSRIERNTEE